MAWPIIAGAAVGALAGFGKNRKEAKERENAYAAAEDARKRRELEYQLVTLPQLHGAEQRKTMGNLFARGMWGNFGRDPATGAVRSNELQAITWDPWTYRPTTTLMQLSPHRQPLPKPKGSFWGGFADVLGGAGQGAMMGYQLGGGYGGYGGGGGYSGNQLLSAAGYQRPTMASLQMPGLATGLA